MCTYDVVYLGVTVDSIKGKYGCGVDLGIQLLEQFKEKHHLYKTIAMIKVSEDIKGKLNA